MILDAHAMTTWQSCQRRHALEADWRVIRWRPSHLFANLLRRAIFSLSNAGDWESLAADAKASFLQTAANPGLDLPPGANPYTIARTWSGMFDTILASVAKTPLLTVRESPAIALSPSVTWQPRSWRDESGQLHRWLTIDDWDESAFAREMHSWRTIGDIAATRSPMMIHVIEIGRATAGGRSCPWSRAWRHPGLRTLPYRFRKPTGGELSSGWLPYHYNDTRDDAMEWAGRLVAEGEYERATHHLMMESPTDAQASAVVRDVLVESLAMRNSAERSWRDIPMSRGACDAWTPCPYLPACYGNDTSDLVTLGLFQRRGKDTLVAIGQGRDA
jgi:hypothetical protein